MERVQDECGFVQAEYTARIYGDSGQEPGRRMIQVWTDGSRYYLEDTDGYDGLTSEGDGEGYATVEAALAAAREIAECLDEPEEEV